MRPRVVFATLLAFGAAMHLALLTTPPRSLVPLALYAGWLVLSGAVALTYWVRSPHAHAALERNRLLRGKRLRQPRVEGLGWFAVSAAAGLVMHVLNAISTSGSANQQRGMWLVFFILAASCSAQLRGAPGDTDAPIPDDSTIARAGSLLRRVTGMAIGLVGVGMFFLGVASRARSGDGFALVIMWFLMASGVVLVLIGLALVFLPRRNDA